MGNMPSRYLTFIMICCHVFCLVPYFHHPHGDSVPMRSHQGPPLTEEAIPSPLMQSPLPPGHALLMAFTLICSNLHLYPFAGLLVLGSL